MDDELTPDELHILYCFHILEMTPEQTAARVWPKAGPIAVLANEAYIRWVFNNIRTMTASGQMPPFQKEDFLEWTGFPAETVKYSN